MFVEEDAVGCERFVRYIDRVDIIPLFGEKQRVAAGARGDVECLFLRKGTDSIPKQRREASGGWNSLVRYRSFQFSRFPFMTHPAAARTRAFSRTFICLKYF